jgi:hypothetical protein
MPGTRWPGRRAEILRTTGRVVDISTDADALVVTVYGNQDNAVELDRWLRSQPAVDSYERPVSRLWIEDKELIVSFGLSINFKPSSTPIHRQLVLQQLQATSHNNPS